MRKLLVFGLLSFVLLAGNAGIVSGKSPLPVRHESAPEPVVSSPGTPDGDGNSTLITRDELYSSVVDADRNSFTASLYFVAQNGTWYNAYSNGSVGTIAPAGPEIPNIADERADIPTAERPVYVWKVTLNGCGTTLYNASSGEVIAAMPIPGCGMPTPYTPLSTATQRTQRTEADAPMIGRGPGFGVGATLMAVLVAVILLRR